VIPILFESVFADKRTALKATMKVTDDLLGQLRWRHILTEDNVSSIKVCHYTETPSPI